MTSKIIAIAVDCLDLDRMAEFWCAALGSEIHRQWRDERGKRYLELGLGPGAGGADSVVLLQPVEEDKRIKNRVHLDLAPLDGGQAGEVARLVELGATVIADEADFPWVVLADPEGNEFCVLPPR